MKDLGPTDTKKHVSFVFDIHAYSEERLCDGSFEPPYYGILGPEIMMPLAKYRGRSYEFEFDENTTLGNLISAVEVMIWGEVNSPYKTGEYAFLVGNERLFIEDNNMLFEPIFQKYLTNIPAPIPFSILVSCDAGEVATEDPLRFYVKSREAGSHHEAHIHVRDTGHQYDASVRISDGKVIAGYLPPKYARLAREKILSDQRYFYNCWNTKTDGLRVDIDKHLGLINY